MPVSAFEFITGTLVIVFFLLVLPFVTIRKLSVGLGVRRNRFDIISAILAYPLGFGFWIYLGEFINRAAGSGAITFYISPMLSYVLVAVGLFIARRACSSDNEDTVL